MIKNVIAELYSVMQRQEKNIQILGKCISWNCQNFRRKRKMRQACYSGCAFLEVKPERILKKWQRKILNWKKHMTCWIN